MKTKHTAILSLIILPLVLISGPVSAGSFTIGQSYGAECYDNAKGHGIGASSLNVCNRAIEGGALAPKDRAATYINRGIVRAFHDDLQGALNDYDKALQIKPAFAEAFANRGNVYIRMERFDDALAALNTALSLDLINPERVYYNRAIVYEKQGRMREAYLDLKKAASLAPNWNQPKYELQRYQVVSR